MDKDQHHDIDKLFQDAFGNYEATPPSNMWSQIEGSLPLTETDLLFKGALENYEKQPSPEVWNKIKPALPLSLTLRNVLVQLSKIAAVLLIGITLYVFVQKSNWLKHNSNNIAQQEQPVIVQEEIEQQEIEPTLDEVLDHEQIAVLDNEQTPISNNTIENSNLNHPYKNNPDYGIKGGKTKKKYASEVTLNIDAIARRVKNGDNTRIPSNELFSKNTYQEENSKIDTLAKEGKVQSRGLKPLNKRRMEDLSSINEFLPLDLDGKVRKQNTERAIAQNQSFPLYLSLQGQPDEHIDNSGIRIRRSNLAPEVFTFKGFYISANAALGNSFMFNSKMKDGVMGEKASYNLISFGSNLGLVFGYQIAPKLSIETGFNYLNQNQSYQNSENGDVINLNYYAVPVTMKYRTNEISTRKPSAISYVFGIQTAFLEKTTTIHELSPIPFAKPQSLAIQTELGITAGIDYDFYLNKNLSWTIGGRVNYGTDLANPFENNNAFIGIRSAFNFRLTK